MQIFAFTHFVFSVEFFFKILTLYQFGPVGFINQFIVFKKKKKRTLKGQDHWSAWDIKILVIV